VLVGLKNLDVGPLNERLGNRVGALNDNSIAVGGIGWGSVGPGILLGGEGAGFWQKTDGPTLKVRLGGAYGFFDVGYMVVRSKGLRLYPMVGIGGGGMSLKLTPAGVPSPTFDEVIDNPGREAEMSVGGLAFNFALGLEYFFTRSYRARRQPRGLHVGIRAGYVLMPGKADWTLEELDVTGGPNVTLDGFYLQAVLGGWGRRPQSEQ